MDRRKKLFITISVLLTASLLVGCVCASEYNVPYVPSDVNYDEISLYPSGEAGVYIGENLNLENDEKATEAALALIKSLDSSQLPPTVVCKNGIFVGAHEDATGVVTFKGIPYAQQPVGELRWKAPLPAKESTEIYDATKFGHTSLQTVSDGEPASKNAQGEDCLTLNVWTKDLEKPNKKVMVFIHGGGYFAGGSSDPMYNGQYLAGKDDEIIVVTINYRIGLMGFIDFSNVIGGEDFKESGYLGVLDVVCALQWIQDNIESFGGNPNEVTIFGESAGAGMVGILLSSKYTDGLFHRAILESGDASFTATKDDAERLGKAETLLQVTNSRSMKDLMRLSSEDLSKALIIDSGNPLIFAKKIKPNNGLENLIKEFENMLVMKNMHPLRGGDSPISDNPYVDIQSGVSKDVDVLIGTNADECRYFIKSVSGKNDFEKMKNYSVFVNENADRLRENSYKSKKIIDKFYDNVIEYQDMYSLMYYNIWEKTELVNEYFFRLPAIRTAESHVLANGNGKTYMYYFAKGDSEKPFLGSGHAAELPYVFNTKVPTHPPVDEELQDKISSMWINFAKTGNPSIEGFEWKPYTLENRETLLIDEDSSLQMVNDLKGDERELLMPLLDEIFPRPRV